MGGGQGTVAAAVHQAMTRSRAVTAAGTVAAQGPAQTVVWLRAGAGDVAEPDPKAKAQGNVKDENK